MIETIKYTLKVWLTTATVSPLTAWLILICIDPSDIYNAVAPYFLILVTGLVASFPAWILFSITVYYILKLEASVSRLKALIKWVALELALATLLLFALSTLSISILENSIFGVITAPYIACLFVSIHFYKPPQPYTDQQENVTT